MELESNYYQEYEYISFFVTEPKANHPLGEMVTSPSVHHEWLVWKLKLVVDVDY